MHGHRKKQIDIMKGWKDMKKLYILLRTDLNPFYATVQAGHGVAAWSIHDTQKEWNNGHLIYLEGGTESDLEVWKRKLTRRGLEYAEWREPDLDNQLTAIACYSKSTPFANTKLMKG